MVTFQQYLAKFRSIQGGLAVALGLSGPFCQWFHVLSPPIEGIGFFTPLVLLISLLFTYLAYRVFSLHTRGCQRIAFAVLTIGLLCLLHYFIWEFPQYIYSSSPPEGVKRRAVVADEDYYTQAAKDYVDRFKKEKGASPSRLEVIESFTLDHISMVFSREGLDKAQFRLTIWYLFPVLLLDLGFCFMVMGEASK